MSQGHRLGRLQVSEARHHRAGMLQGPLRQHLLQGRQRCICGIDGVANIEPEIRRDLIVAGARGVQPAGGRADQLAEPAFDIHVNVLERTLEIERSGIDF